MERVEGECNGEMCTIKCGEGVQSVAESLPAGELVPATRHTAHCQHQCAMCQHNLPKDVMAPPFRTREGDGEGEGERRWRGEVARQSEKVGRQSPRGRQEG